MSTEKTPGEKPKTESAKKDPASKKATASKAPTPPDPPSKKDEKKEDAAPRTPKQNSVKPALVGAGLAILMLLLIGLIALAGIKLMNGVEKAAPQQSAENADANAEIQRLKAELESTRTAVAPPETHPSVNSGVKTFDPTTLLNGRNAPNIPTVTRVKKVETPSGDFYLLFGEDPILKRERMITNGGSPAMLPEPEWKVTRPPGELMILTKPLPGLTLPPGRHAVAVVSLNAKG